MAIKKGLARTSVFLVLLAFSAFYAPAVAAGMPDELVPMGCAIGIDMSTEGVLVAGVRSVSTPDGEASPAAEAGIEAGDVIRVCGGAQIRSGDDLNSALASLDGSPVRMTLEREGVLKEASVTPALNCEGGYELGLSLRDGMAGIGTVTFFDPDTGMFGALGHSINDVDTGILMPLRDGKIMRSVITDVQEGLSGSPGQLIGSFSQDGIVGSLRDNGMCGIFGIMENCDLTCAREAIPVAYEAELETGSAVILSNVSDNAVGEFDVEITRIFNRENDARCLMLEVTDPELLEATGGIVQGMSGSPIIQNGKIVGAVTHVLVNDPTRGYGISMERMLDAAAEVFDSAA